MECACTHTLINYDTTANLRHCIQLRACAWQPHFDDLRERTIEAYLCHDFGGTDFYGAEMRLLVCAFLRPQAKFESFEALIEAITTDVEFGQAALDAPELLAMRDDSFLSTTSAALPPPAAAAEGGAVGGMA